MSDLISKQKAIERIEWWFGILKQNSDILIDVIKTLPDEETERKRDTYCDCCKYDIFPNPSICRKCCRAYPDEYERKDV